MAEVQFDNNQTIAVTCYFAEGSQALGCHVQLIFSSDSLALNISRVNRSLIIRQEIKTRFPSHCYQSQFYVYDWEADGTVGTLPVETVFSEGALEACETITLAPGPVNPGVCLICITVHAHTLKP